MTGPEPPQGLLVVGLGSVDRGDDAIGPTVADMVADRIAEHGPDDAHVVAHEDPTALLDLMVGHRAVVVVDATSAGIAPGTVTLHHLRPEGPDLPARTGTGPAGTHALGLAASLALARALDRLPARLCVVGVEAAAFEHGAGLSTAVAQAVPEAVAACLACLEEV